MVCCLPDQALSKDDAYCEAYSFPPSLTQLFSALKCYYLVKSISSDYVEPNESAQCVAWMERSGIQVIAKAPRIPALRAFIRAT